MIIDGILQESNVYDECGRLIQRRDGAGNGVSIRYDLDGRRTVVETTGGASQQFEYDPLGNIIGAVDGVGNRTGYNEGIRDEKGLRRCMIRQTKSWSQ